MKHGMLFSRRRVSPCTEEAIKQLFRYVALTEKHSEDMSRIDCIRAGYMQCSYDAYKQENVLLRQLFYDVNIF